jgi:hypothetical protein
MLDRVGVAPSSTGDPPHCLDREPPLDIQCRGNWIQSRNRPSRYTESIKSVMHKGRAGCVLFVCSFFGAAVTLPIEIGTADPEVSGFPGWPNPHYGPVVDSASNRTEYHEGKGWAVGSWRSHHHMRLDALLKGQEIGFVMTSLDWRIRTKWIRTYFCSAQRNTNSTLHVVTSYRITFSCWNCTDSIATIIRE